MSRPKHNQDGIALLEFAIVLPLIIFFLILSVEFTRWLQSDKTAIALSRESANVIMRECGSDSADSELAVCVARRTAELRNVIRVISNEAKLRITLLVSNPSSGAIEEYTAGNFTSEILPARGNSYGPIPASYIRSRGYVVAAEIFVPRNPLFPELVEALQLNIGDHYELTFF